MSAPPETELLGTLDLLHRRRQPYGELLRQIVDDTLTRFPPEPGQTILEIGAGTGQLREWMPPALRALTIHTDPSEAALRALRQRAPGARTRVAHAEQLPLADAEAGAVLGLCVFDAIKDEAEVTREITRVLAPGGRFIHFADMATLLEAPFAKLAVAGLCPLPNVFGDPGDYPWPLDIVLVKRDWLAGLVDVTRRLGHPLPAALSGYFTAFLGPSFDTEGATKVFRALAASHEWRALLRSLLESAGQASFASGYPAVEPLPFHSGRYLESVLNTSFRQSDGFRVELSEIVTRSRWRSPTEGNGPRYQSLCLGHQRIADELPARLLAELPGRTSPHPEAADLALVEAGMFVFVATRQ